MPLNGGENMSNYVPLRFIKVGPDFSVPIHRIVGISEITSYSTQQLIAEQKKNKTLISATKKFRTKCVVILDNGTVITSPYTMSTITKKINEMQTYDINNDNIKITKKSKTIKDVEINEYEDDFGELDLERITKEIKDGYECSEEDCDT